MPMRRMKSKKRPVGRPRLPADRRRLQLTLYVPAETCAAFKKRYGATWRRAMADILDAAAKGWRNSRNNHVR